MTADPGAVWRFKNWATANRRGIAATVKNISWLSAENFANTLVAAVVSVVVARTLGADAVGTWGYVFAIYSVALIVVTLGTDQILMVDLATGEIPRGTIMATALVLRLAAALLMALVLACLPWLSKDVTPHQNALIRVLACSLIIMAFDAVGSWFRSQQQFSRVVVPSMASTLVGGAAKIFFVVHNRSILPLGVLTVGQSALMQLLVGLSAYRSGVPGLLGRFSAAYARELLRTSLPLMLSGLAVFVYLRANVFFLNEFGSKTDVGLYNAAAAISSVAYFIPTVIVTTLTPAFYRRYHSNRAQFERDFARLSDVLTLSLAAISLVVMLLSERVIVLLYGPAFRPAAPVLALHVWTLIPVAYGLLSSVWLAASKRTGLMLTRTLCGGVVNLALNLLLIPRLGIIGAALATLVAMLTASMFTLVLGADGRQILRVQLRSLVLANLFRMLSAPRRVSQ